VKKAVKKAGVNRKRVERALARYQPVSSDSSRA